MGARGQRDEPAGDQSRHRGADRRDPEHGHRRDAPRDRGRLARAGRLGGAHGEGALEPAAPLVRADDRASAGPRRADDRGTGQAARGIQGRNRLRRVLHRMVRRGRQAPVRRRDTSAPERQAHPRAAPAGRRRRRDHAMEFSVGDDHAQGRPCARGRLHGGVQAGHADALFGARAGGTRRARRNPARASSMSSPARRRRSAPK